MSTQLSTESGDAKKGFSTHQNNYNIQARRRGIYSIFNTRDIPLIRRSEASSARSVANLSPAQLDRKRKNDRDTQRVHRQRTKECIEQLEQRVQELEYLLVVKNAPDNNNVGSGMPMDLDQNMGADTANTKRQIYTHNNMAGAFGKGTSTGDIYNVGEEGGYGDIAFSNHESLASGNLYTTDIKNSFHEKLPMVGQPLKYRRLIPFSTKSSNERRKNETHML
ncbi:hypothetical protein VE00_09476 [Pseudogymnoascus sp. WSF 3629]|nr:hypothetical protein VE00_09476 [Pseudogymnoascus sp. WSF 3629]